MNTTAQTHVLFLDLQEIESMENTELVVNQAEKCPANPVLPLGDLGAWDRLRATPWAGSIIFDDEERIFKLWYFGGPGEQPFFTGIGYAWSEDGITWHKPSLGLYEYRGSTDNNICFQSPTGIQLFMYGTISHGLAEHFTVTKDLRESDHNRRYKGWTLIYWAPDNCQQSIAVYSPDGIHWTVGEKPVPYPIRDTTDILIDDDDPDPARRIKAYGNPNPNSELGHVDMGFGPDLEHMQPNPENPVFTPGLEHTIHLFSVLRYRGYYLALYDYNFWQDYDGMRGDVSVREIDPRVPEPKTGAFVGDIRLAVSRDGSGPFTRINAHQPLVERGARGAWDGLFLVLPGPVVRDDEIFIFYTGVDETGGSLPNQAEVDLPVSLRTGLAKLRPDGFTHLQAHDGYGPARVTTRPITVEGSPQLILNAARLMPYRDWIEVEVLDAVTDMPLDGYGRADCRKLAQEDRRIPVKWHDSSSFDGIAVPQIKLRFYLYGRARLHSFTFDA